MGLFTNINAPTFSGPTNLMAMGHPFCAPAYNDIPGMPIGIDIRTKEIVYFDPWYLKHRGLINSAFGLIIGPKGHGKSATMKILAMRLSMVAAGYSMIRIVVNDYKPEGAESEYGQVSRVMRSKPFQIAEMSINPFEARLYQIGDESAYRPGLVSTAEVILEFGKGAPLTGAEKRASRIALSAMLQNDESLWTPQSLHKAQRGMTDAHITDYLSQLDRELEAQLLQRVERAEHSGNSDRVHLNSAREDIKELVALRDNVDLQDVKVAGDQVSTYLGAILTGSFAHMFGGTHSLYEMLTQRIVTKDWRGVSPDAETLMRTIDTSIKTSAIENNRQDLLPHIEIDDEKHKSMDNEVYARSHSYFSEIARGTHTCNLSATHRLDSIRKGGAGSELDRLANTIINNLGFVFIGHQKDKDTLEELKFRYSLSDADTQALTMLRPYTFGIKIGEEEPLRFVKIFATPMELSVLKTDAATERMVDRPDVYDEAQIQRFAQENGITYIGQGAI